VRAAKTRAALLAGLCIFGATRAGAEQPRRAQTASAPVALELIVLGSGGPAALGRAGSSYLVLLDGRPRILVDAGPGSFARLGEARVPIDALDLILLTHLHADHAGELPGIIKARAVSAGQPIRFEIYGPTGRAAQQDTPAFPSTSRFVELMFGAEGAFAYLKDFSAPVTFKTTDLPVTGAAARAPRIIFSQADLSIRAVAGHHGDAPAIIYRIDYRGHSIAFSGDIDASGLPALADIAQGANLLVFDAVVLDPPGSPEVLYSLHSPPHAIGALAQRSQVGQLLLSHLSPAVTENRKAVTASIAQHFRGRVTFAADGMHVRP
jgi:ribonuclease BN (tRNA processing enzyme)